MVLIANKGANRLLFWLSRRKIGLGWLREKMSPGETVMLLKDGEQAGP